LPRCRSIPSRKTAAMAKERPDDAPLPLVDDPDALEVFADELAGLTFQNGNFHLTLSSTRADFSTDPATRSRVAVLRLILPLPSLLIIQEQLAHAIGEMEAQKLFERTAVPDDSVTIH
jgi:hypothetical protein